MSHHTNVVSESKPKIKRNYGWKKSEKKPDEKYHCFLIHPFHSTITKVDLIEQIGEKTIPVYDQGELGSCTGNAISFAYQYDEVKQKEVSPFAPSRLFVYYNERAVEGTVNEDSGAQISTGINVIHTIGVIPETMWPYDITQFNVKPPQACYDAAKKHETGLYRRVPQTLDQIKACLINNLVVVFGFTVYDYFESEEMEKTGILKMPQKHENCQGGHAVSLVGFQDDKKLFKIRNSWGESWGPFEGYFFMPYAYLLDPNLADDLWTIGSVLDQA